MFDATSDIPASAVGYNRSIGGEGVAYGTAEERMKRKHGSTAEGKVKYIIGLQIKVMNKGTSNEGTYIRYTVRGHPLQIGDDCKSIRAEIGIKYNQDKPFSQKYKQVAR